MRTLLIALRAALVTAVLTGIVYPLAVLGIARVAFPRAAEGSLVRDADGSVVGSELIAQGFSSRWYFQPRPSAAGDKGYDASSSGGSNYGPTSVSLVARAKASIEALRAANPDAKDPVPAELVTCSGSGLDPHISPAAARWQVPRIADARDVSPGRVQALVDAATEGRTLGFLGEPRVNVLLLNLALDRELGRVKAAPK